MTEPTEHRGALARLVGYVADHLPPPEPPDRTVVRIVWGGGFNLGADYLERDDTFAADHRLPADDAGARWFPVGDDEPLDWAAVVRSAGQNPIEVLVAVSPADTAELARRAKVLRDQLEEIIGEAYDIGYAHGGNALRLERLQTPHRVDDGWGPLVDQAVAAINQAQGGQR